MVKFLKGNLGIYLCGRDVRVPKDAADTLDGHAIVKREDGKRVTCAVHGDPLMEPTLIHDATDTLGQRPVLQ